MTKRLTSLQALDELEGLTYHHRKLQSRLEELGADAALFDTPLHESLEVSRKANEL